ncbi:MAG: hypothetical protein LBB53_04105, partial [Prevotellaceae bacterium]|nr:hypothetical protein [Prevotellaceae bacterium]
MKKLYSLVILLYISILCYAIPAKPVPVKVVQPDGTELIIRLNGDENFHYITTEDGILIAKNAKNFYEYASMDEDGKIFPIKIIARQPQFRTGKEILFLKTLNSKISVENIALNIRNLRAEQKSSLMKISSANSPAQSAAVGEKGIAILVNFSDKAFVTPDANTAFCNMLNQTGYSKYNAIGSARDYFIASSDSLFQPTFDVYGPYTLPQNMTYYGSNDSYGNDKNPEQMVIDACILANAAGVDFSQYDTDGDGNVDNVFIFYAGYGEASGASSNTIWPHRH